jgi:hypothetical protein
MKKNPNTKKSTNKLKIKELASIYSNMLITELKKNKSLTETQKTEIQNERLNIQTYK